MTNLLKGMKVGKKTGAFEWLEAAYQAFAELKQRFANTPVLHYYDPAQPCLIETDASGFAISAVLS
jgi:hypothetical protein